MPFSHQLKFPPLNGSVVKARIDAWRKKPLAFIERGDPIADIFIGGTAYTLSIDFPCALSSVIAQPVQLKEKIFHTAVNPSSSNRSNQALQPTALWRCASMSILISVSSNVAQPRSQSSG